MEVADNLVDADDTFKTASFAALGFDALSVVFALALFNVGAFAEGPLFLRVCFSDFLASVAATGLDGIGRSWCPAALAAVLGVEVFCFFGVTGYG